MARPKLLKRAEAAAYSTRRGITASAARVDLRDPTERQEHAQRAQRSQWQDTAWDHFDRIGEVSFGYGLVASVMSRVRLYPAVVVDPDAPPVSLTDATTIERPEDEGDDGVPIKPDNGINPQQALEARDMFRRSIGKSDIPGMMQSFALNVSVPGECYLALIDGKWQLKSTSELQVDTSGRPKLYRIAGSQPRELPETTPIGRVWRQHPRYSGEAYSAMKSLAEDCEELLLLSRIIRSNGRARLNAGLLFVPEELSLASQTTTDDEDVPEDEEGDFEKELSDGLIGPAEDEQNANTIIPVLLRGPGELGDKIKHILFGREMDQYLVERADRVLERILQGLDIPKDVVTGLANVKYSNAVQIDESLFKAHVEPLCLMIVDAITDIIYRPLLRAAGWSPEDVDRMVVWYDPSEVTTRPDRAADAKTLYDARELSGSALRQAHGFSDADKPTEDELAVRTALANIPPEAILQALYMQALPKILGEARGAAATENLPDELRDELGDTTIPEDPGQLDPTVGDTA